MRNLLVAIATSLTVLLPRVGDAQAAPDQDATLLGLNRVRLTFDKKATDLKTALAAKLDSVMSFELRKTGIRLLDEQSPLGPDDGLLTLRFVRQRHGINTRVMFSLDLYQMAQLQRTKQHHAMVSWHYEAHEVNTSFENAAPSMLSRGANEFIAAWMRANGR